MPCKRCSLHTINYPTNYNRCLVPGCDEDLSWFSNVKPDEDYEDKAASIASLLDDNDAGLHVNVHIAPELIHLAHLAIPDCTTAQVTEFKGLSWVGHHALLRSGYSDMREFDVVMIHGKFYELQGRAHPELASGALAGGVWWVEEMDPDTFRFPDTFEEVNEIWQRS